MRSPCALVVLSTLLEFWKSRAVPVVEQQHPVNGATELKVEQTTVATSSASSTRPTASSNPNAITILKADVALQNMKAATPKKDAHGRAILAAPTPDGHTAQVSPVHPNSDREWYPEGREYEAQNGPITEDPDHAPVRNFKQAQPAEKSSAADPPERRSAFLVACFALLGALAFGALPPPLFAFL